jgi:hypothetical protein
LLADLETAGIKPVEEFISRSLYDRDYCQSTNEKRRRRQISANRALRTARVDVQQNRPLLFMMKTTD